MDDIDFTLLIKILATTKASYYGYQEKDVLINNVANFGAKIGDIAKLERKGEYYGISVEFMEDTIPLLLHHNILKILNMLKKEEYSTALTILGLTTLDELKYVLHKWFQIATTGYNNEIGNSKKNYPKYDRWIKSVTHDPILTKIRVREIGSNQNTGASVVPEDWIDREFKNADELHMAMDKLETRIGKPSVTFAVIYSMIIQKQDVLIKKIKNLDCKHIFYLDLADDKLVSDITIKKRNGYQYVKYNDVLIGFKINDILEPKNVKSDAVKEVGLLVSRLQKAIRRGKFASRAIIETIDSLNESPNYNLPEHNFMRVSSSKQMVWRLFISILEDCRPYQAINEMGLLELILLTLITQKLSEYKFTKPVLHLIKLTALLAQYNDTTHDVGNWRKLAASEKTDIIPESHYHSALALAINNIIMMSGDKRMLQKYYSEKKFFEPFIDPVELKTDKWKTTIKNNKYVCHDDEVYQDVIYNSYDMHVKPYIILYYQACIPISLTTQQISGYIWDIASSYNIRNGKPKQDIDPVLRTIQKYLKNSGDDKNKQKSAKLSKKDDLEYEKQEINNDIKRSTFLVLFGKKYRYNGKDVVLAGTRQLPIRIKIDNEWTEYKDKDVLDAYPKRQIDLSKIDPPSGFRWKREKVMTEIINSHPHVDGKRIPWFDGSSLTESVIPIINKTCDKQLYGKILEIFSGLDIEFTDLIKMRQEQMHELVNWLPKKSDRKKFNLSLVSFVYTKIFNNMNNLIMVGPVTRGGDKMQNSINYSLEGKAWAIFNIFCYLYPETIQPNGALNFKINKATAGYVHMLSTLQKIIFIPKEIQGIVPKIKTKLWDHQEMSVTKILTGFSGGKRGFGDASDVGSGKTLTALSIAVHLIQQENEIHSGILVLLPGNNLIKTWQDELKKHTIGFDVKYQKNTNKIGAIQKNTIVITTMARIRDHPINHKWLLVVIDECLTVQNRNALWTQAAWMQSLMSKHLIMMSATFFRARFDKLYYMLKMLQSGLPEERDYLDVILLETIVSQVSKVKRTWTSNINYFDLDKKSRAEYDEINALDIGIEAKFAKLSAYLVKNAKENTSLVEQLDKKIKELQNQKHRCLIYAKSNDEAKLWSEYMNIPIYPDKGQHCIITYHDGTYGLNDLVIYNTIVMRPPPPDLIPQIKGRLDRPGNSETQLYIEYFVLKNTIEQGLVLRMNIAASFIQKYIMPLSKFYDISVNYEKYE